MFRRVHGIIWKQFRGGDFQFSADSTFFFYLSFFLSLAGKVENPEKYFHEKESKRERDRKKVRERERERERERKKERKRDKTFSDFIPASNVR